MHTLSLRGPRDRRAGLGALLILVLVMLIVLAAIGLAHGRFASSVSLVARRDAAGDRAVELARAALAAAHFVVTRAANDPDADPALHARLRSELKGFQIVIPSEQLPGFGEELTRSRGFVLERGGVALDVGAQVPASPGCPTEYDRCGSVRLAAAVLHEGTDVVRRLTETYDLKVALAAPLRPFDLATVAVAEAKPLVDAGAPGGSANAAIGNSAARPATIKAHAEQYRTDLGKVPETIASLTGAEVERAKQLLAEALQILETTITSLPPPLTVGPGQSGPNALHPFPEGPFALFSAQPQVDLARLDLPTRVGAVVARLTDAEATYTKATDALSAFLIAKTQDLTALPGLQRAWGDAALLVCKTWKELGLEYKAVQDLCVEVSGGAYAELAAHMQALAPGDYYARAAARVGEEGPIKDELEALLSRGSSWNGILYCENPTQELTLDRTFAGQLVLVVQGNLTVSRVAVEDPSRDRITVVCFGRVTLQGPFQGSLVSAGSLSSESDVRVRGSVVLRTAVVPGLPTQRILTGTVDRDPGVAAGPRVVDATLATVFADRQIVTVAPYPVAARLDRK